MKKFASAAALVGAALALAGPATAEEINKARLDTFSYNAATKTGTLKTYHRKLGKATYRVNRKSDCGVSYGQSGDSIPCKTLGSAKYDGKVLFIRWHRDANLNRIIDSVGVDMTT